MLAVSEVRISCRKRTHLALILFTHFEKRQGAVSPQSVPGFDVAQVILHMIQ